MENVRLGVIGVGTIGSTHLKNAAALERATVTAVCDVVPERAWAAAAEHSCRAYLDADELRASVLKMKPFIIHTTAADYVRQPRYHYDSTLTNFMEQDAVLRAVPLGKGIIDYDAFFGALKEIGYQGYIAYEMCEVLDGGGSIENLDRTARESLAFLKSFESR